MTAVELVDKGQEDSVLLGYDRDTVLVTVVCVTYNQENYIAQALDSFLMQKTDFRFKVFVGEDCGSDRTADIVRDYAERYPDIIVPFIRETNLGSQRNSIDMCSHAESRYIAFCDGDDYWIDELKLQKQVDFMETHPECCFCFGRTKIIPSKHWDQKDYYIPNDNGDYILPDCVPDYHPKTGLLDSSYIVDNLMSAHTSTYFFRWNYDIEYPAWFFDGVLGDSPLRLMQIGEGYASGLDDVLSAYRVNETGVFTSYDSTDELFINTRHEYIRWMSGILGWYEENGYKNYPKVKLQNRIIKEFSNLVQAEVNCEDFGALIDLMKMYPQAAKMGFEYYLSANRDRRALEATFGWSGYKAIVRNSSIRRSLKPIAKLATRYVESPMKKRIKRQVRNFKSLISYWCYAVPAKDKRIWVVSGFRQNSYCDNTMYFYEHVLQYNPEISIYWYTNDKKLYDNLIKDGKPAILAGTKECKKIVCRASLAIVDHYASTDFSRTSGFNAKTKVVQLWHGVGLKSQVKKGGQNNTGESTVKRSTDILAQPSDSLITRFVKRIMFIRYSYRRELYENYFLFLTPGDEMVEHMGHEWGIPDSCYYRCGYPRVDGLLDKERSRLDQGKGLKILYAPTYRWKASDEKKLLQGFFDSCEDIQKLMESVDGTFVLRMHPHTWRNYRGMISLAIKPFDRIVIDDELDAYKSLASYAMAITDYSSIILDFALLHRPTIYFFPDYNDYENDDCGLIPDFKSRITGSMTTSWNEVLDAIRGYLEAPNKDIAFLQERLSWFYDPVTTDKDNSKRIVEELKRRLGIDD